MTFVHSNLAKTKQKTGVYMRVRKTMRVKSETPGH